MTVRARRFRPTADPAVGSHYCCDSLPGSVWLWGAGAGPHPHVAKLPGRSWIN